MEVFKLIDKYIVNVLFASFNLLSNLVFIFSFKKRRIVHRNKKLKTNNESCFILGNGPSLKDVDLSLLKNKDTFAVNYFYKHNPDGFESKYFVAIDDRFYWEESAMKYLEDTYENHKDIIFILKYSALSRRKWDMSRTFFINAKCLQYADKAYFDCTKNMTACINVVLQCIQIAMFMGYKKIYLLGCDFSQYAQVKPGHFYDSNLQIRDQLNMGDDARWAYLVHYHHYALRKIADKKGIEIINLTENSLLDAYKFDSLENVIQ